MIDSIFSKKVVVIIGVVIAIISVVAVIYILFKDSPEEEIVTTTDAPMRVDEVGRVFIKDFNELKGSIDQDTHRQVERRLYGRASNQAPDLYTGIIRQNSYSATAANKVNTVKFLVDVSPIKTTYQVTVVTLDGDSSVTVACASEQEQLDKSITCEDPEYT